MKLTKDLMVISIRGGIEISIDGENLEKIQVKLSEGGFIQVGRNIINTKDIVGVFEPFIIADSTRRKNGDWKCSKNVWHSKNEKCFCKDNGFLEAQRQKARDLTSL